MLKNLIRCFILLFFAISIYGCGSTKDVKVRAYKQDKKRVDQEITGKLGNWQNSSDVVIDPERRETRKIYVMEFIKEAEAGANIPDADVGDLKRQPSRSTIEDAPVVQNRRQVTQKRKIEIPNFDDGSDSDMNFANDDSSLSGETSLVDYKVEKDDTLQKISKKFYGSYSKWPKIYEANKAILKSPDFLKPGIVLKIPVQK